MNRAVALSAGLATGGLVLVAARRRRGLPEKERSLLEIEILAALDEVDAQRALLNAEFARRL